MKPAAHEDDPVPILAGPEEFWPTHALMGASQPGGEATVGADGLAVPYKIGSKFAVHRSELLGPDGRVLRVFPLYADTLKTGPIEAPFSKRVYMGHGGAGYGSDPKRYGIYGWASLHNMREDYKDRDSTRTPGQPAINLSKHIQEEVAKRGGALGLVFKGGHYGAAAANKMIWGILADEIEHLHATGQVPDVGKLLASDEGLKEHGIDSLSALRAMASHRHSATSRGNALKKIVGRLDDEDKAQRDGKKRRAAPRELDEIVRQVWDSALDYHHVPAGHATTVVRFGPGYSRENDQDDNETYMHQHRGVYLGELQHSIPMQQFLPDSAREKVAARGKGAGMANLSWRTMIAPHLHDAGTSDSIPPFAKSVGLTPEEREVEEEILRHALLPSVQPRLQEAVVGAAQHGPVSTLAERMGGGTASEAVAKALGFAPAAGERKPAALLTIVGGPQ